MLLKKKVYVDMDGVLAAFNPNASMDEMLSEGYFRNLPPMTENIQAFNALAERSENVFILSKVLSETAVREKNEWLDRHHVNIPKERRIFINNNEDKSGYFAKLTKDDVLCDDFSKNLIEWSLRGGTAVKILNGLNGSGKKFAGKRIRIEDPQQLLRCLDSL